MQITCLELNLLSLFDIQPLQTTTKKAKQLLKELYPSIKDQPLLLESPSLHEYREILISLGKNEPLKSFYPGKILSLSNNSFQFQLFEPPENPIKEIPYHSLHSILVLLKENESIVGARYARFR